MNPRCPLCHGATEFFSEYLYYVEHDELYLGKPSIYRCVTCNLGCTHPEPDLQKVSFYYEKVFRSPGRPHYTDPTAIPDPMDRHFAALNALLPAIYAQEANRTSTDKIKILEIGAGWGEVGQLLKTISKDIEVTTIEPCTESQKSLRLRGYNIANSASELKEQKFDAVISLHVLEHFHNPHAFFSLFKDLTKQGALLFLEMPNCPMDERFEKRPYDSPHLTFWNKTSMLKLSEEFGLELLSMCSSSISLDANFPRLNQSKKVYGAWSPQATEKTKRKNAITRLKLKAKAKRFAKKVLASVGLARRVEISKEDLIPYSPDSNQSCIRGLYRLKK